MKLTFSIVGLVVVFYFGTVLYETSREAEDLRYAKMVLQRGILNGEIKILENRISMTEQISGPATRWIGGKEMTPDAIKDLVLKDPDKAHKKIKDSLGRAVLMRHVVAGEPLESAKVPVADRCHLLSDFRRKYALEAAAEVASSLGPFDRAMKDLDMVLSLRDLRNLSSRFARETQEPEVPVLATSAPGPVL